MKKLLLVDDHEIIRDALRMYFESVPEFEISGEAQNGKEALRLLALNKYDVVITDISMPQMDGVELMENIRLNYPDQKVLVLSSHTDPGSIQQMVAYGAQGYILKNAPQKKMISALNDILDGKEYYEKEVHDTVAKFIARKKREEARTTQNEISEKEKEVLELIIKGYTDAKIAFALYVSDDAVRELKRNLLKKTGCKDIAGLVMYAVEKDLV